MLKLNRIIVALSGGVDSAVAAFLLKSKGFNVEGVFMENWDIRDERGHCPSDEDYADAAELCANLNIKLHKVNFVKQYWNEVFSNLVKDYENGLTPNPDILCNRNIKFNHLYDYAMNTLKADALATGHYACSSFGPYLENYEPDKDVKLLKARDSKKDQIFFLCQVEQRALRRTMFPLGQYLKSEVKELAKTNGLEKFAYKKESMGICFIGSRHFQDFIEEYIEDKPGTFIDIDTANVMGQHKGFHQWTLGQRSRISGLLEPYYIGRKNVETNDILLARGSDNPFLHSRLFFTTEPHWISSPPQEITSGNLLECDFKFQHNEDWVPCKIFKSSKGLIVLLNTPKRAITPGQFAVFCRKNECLGSARIIGTPVSEFSLSYNSRFKEFTEDVQNRKAGIVN